MKDRGTGNPTYGFGNIGKSERKGSEPPPRRKKRRRSAIGLWQREGRTASIKLERKRFGQKAALEERGRKKRNEQSQKKIRSKYHHGGSINRITSSCKLVKKEGKWEGR